MEGENGSRKTEGKSENTSIIGLISQLVKAFILTMELSPHSSLHGCRERTIWDAVFSNVHIAASYFICRDSHDKTEKSKPFFLKTFTKDPSKILKCGHLN